MNIKIIKEEGNLVDLRFPIAINGKLMTIASAQWVGGKRGDWVLLSEDGFAIKDCEGNIMSWDNPVDLIGLLLADLLPLCPLS